MPKILNSLVFSGSGDKFCCQLGSWKVLEQVVKPEILVGTSGGAIIASMIAMDYTFNQMLRIIKDLDIPTLLDYYWTQPLSLFQSDKLAFMEGKKIYQKLKATFNIRFKDTRYPLVICVTDAQNKTLKIFGTKETPDAFLYDALRASISLPCIFSPHIIDNIQYVDGGISENFYLKYFSREKHNLYGIRMVDKPNNSRITDIKKLMMETIFIPIVQNELKNIEDCPNAKIINIETETDNYDFSKLSYQYMLDLISHGELETIKQFLK